MVGQDFSREDMHGAWADTSSSSDGFGLLLYPDSSWNLIIHGNIINHEAESEDGSIISYFLTNFDQNPHTIELIAENKTNNEVRSIQGTFAFRNREEIQMTLLFKNPDDYYSDPVSLEVNLMRFEE